MRVKARPLTPVSGRVQCEWNCLADIRFFGQYFADDTSVLSQMASYGPKNSPALAQMGRASVADVMLWHTWVGFWRCCAAEEQRRMHLFSPRTSLVVDGMSWLACLESTSSGEWVSCGSPPSR